MNKKKSSKIGLLIIIGALIYFTFVFIDQQKLINAKTLEMQNLQDKIAEEKRLNEELRQQKEMINTDEYVEKIAREKLGMVKRGEKVFVDVNR
ncbi:MAG TPA: septum formation initiator family protein [Clostridiaceae bacterium]|nr:septum formation initiator family protein [Clostridiaceae bacterium]